MHMRPLPSVPLPKSEPQEAVLLVLFGSRYGDSAHVGLLHRTQHLCGICTTIFLTAVLASLSGGTRSWTVFQSYPNAITFGLLWGILIFNLDRYIVMSLHKSRGGFGAFCRQVATASPRLLLALLIASVITVPLELKIFEREIIDQLERNHQRTLNEDRRRLSS